MYKNKQKPECIIILSKKYVTIYFSVSKIQMKNNKTFFKNIDKYIR